MKNHRNIPHSALMNWSTAAASRSASDVAKDMYHFQFNTLSRFQIYFYAPFETFCS
jgi:hypothetical protein